MTDMHKQREAFEEVFPCSAGTVLNEYGHYESQVNQKDAMIQNISWVVWQAAKAQAVLEVVAIGNDLQSWVAVNLFSADDGEGVLPVVDANALAEKIEELTGASQ